MKLIGIGRGLIVGLVFLVINLIFVFFKYSPDTGAAWATHVSNGIFQIGLILLVLGVAVFTRLFSYRRRMQLRNLTAMYRAKTPEEYQEMTGDEEEKNERDQMILQEEGRDATFLTASLFLIVLSIVLTIDQVI
jgi:type III secretory pathway component EscU